MICLSITEDGNKMASWNNNPYLLTFVAKIGRKPIKAYVQQIG